MFVDIPTLNRPKSASYKSLPCDPRLSRTPLLPKCRKASAEKREGGRIDAVCSKSRVCSSADPVLLPLCVSWRTTSFTERRIQASKGELEAKRVRPDKVSARNAHREADHYSESEKNEGWVNTTQMANLWLGSRGMQMSLKIRSRVRGGAEQHNLVFRWRADW